MARFEGMYKNLRAVTHGSGWYDANSTAEVGLNITAIPLGNGESVSSIMLTPSLIGVILFGVVTITVTAKLAAKI